MNDLVIKMVQEIAIQGYKKSKLSISKKHKDFFYIIDFQASKYNFDKEESFTINIGIYCPEIYQLIWNKIPKKPKEVDCIFRTRINYFLDSKKDIWWKLSNKESFIETQKFIISIINEKIIPFFDFVDDYFKLRATMLGLRGIDTQYPLFKIQLAVLDFLCNNQEKALNDLHQISITDNVWGEKALEVINNLKR